MTIDEIIWPNDRIAHIARHSVTPEEFEEVCFGWSFVRRVKSQGRNPVYNVMGRTDAGRRLLCVVIGFPDGRGYPITARPLTDRERRRFSRWENQ